MKKSRLRGRKGFTLIELMLVIVIVGFLSAVVGLSINSINTITLNNAAGKVVADLRYAQQLAMTTRSRHGLTIDSAQQYSTHIDNGGVDNPIRDPGNLGQNFVVDFDAYQQGQLSGVRFNSTTPFCTGLPGCATCSNVIEFDSLGAPTDTAGTPLCSPTITTITLTRNGAANQAITIEANTGKITN